MIGWGICQVFHDWRKAFVCRSAVCKRCRVHTAIFARPRLTGWMAFLVNFLIAKFNYRSYLQQQLDTMAYTARLTKQQLRQRRDATRDRSRDNTKGTVQYLMTYAYTNNNCLVCASNIIVSVAIPTVLIPLPLSTCVHLRRTPS